MTEPEEKDISPEHVRLAKHGILHVLRDGDERARTTLLFNLARNAARDRISGADGKDLKKAADTAIQELIDEGKIIELAGEPTARKSAVRRYKATGVSSHVDIDDNRTFANRDIRTTLVSVLGPKNSYVDIILRALNDGGRSVGQSA